MKRKNNILDNIKRTWVDFKDWVEFVKNSKREMKNDEEIDTIREQNKTIQQQKQKIKQLQTLIKTKDECMARYEERIQSLNSKIGELMKEKRGNLCEKAKKPNSNEIHTDIKE